MWGIREALGPVPLGGLWPGAPVLQLLVLRCRSEDGEWDPEAAALMSAGSSEEGLAFSEKVDSAMDGDVANEQARVQTGGAAGDTICLRNLRKVYGAQGKAHSKVGAQTKASHSTVLRKTGPGTLCVV